MTADDIQVFIVTYNRPDLLALQLESLVRQTRRPASVTVLDDGPNPETRRVAERFSSQGICYEKTVEAGLWGNLHEAQKRANREFIAVFHDDDRTHPRYLEFAARALAAHPGTTLLGCNSFDTSPSEPAPFSSDVGLQGFEFDSRDFATFFFNGDFGHFPFFIYRTDRFKSLDVTRYLDYHGPYGKWGDSVFVPLAVGDGRALMLASRLAAYGIHPGQAVSDESSMPDVRCWARSEAVFHSLLGDDLHTWPGFSFAFRNYHRLCSGYRHRGIRTLSFADYLKFAREIGAVSPHASVFRGSCNHLTQKLFLAYGRHRLARELQSLG